MPFKYPSVGAFCFRWNPDDCVAIRTPRNFWDRSALIPIWRPWASLAKANTFLTLRWNFRFLLSFCNSHMQVLSMILGTATAIWSHLQARIQREITRAIFIILGPFRAHCQTRVLILEYLHRKYTLRVNFQKVLTFDFLGTSYTHVLWGIDYEHNSKNNRRFYCHGENHEKSKDLVVNYVYFENHWKFWKIFQTKVINFIEIDIYCCIHFIYERYLTRKTLVKLKSHEKSESSRR